MHAALPCERPAGCYPTEHTDQGLCVPHDRAPGKQLPGASIAPARRGLSHSARSTPWRRCDVWIHDPIRCLMGARQHPRYADRYSPYAALLITILQVSQSLSPRPYCSRGQKAAWLGYRQVADTPMLAESRPGRPRPRGPPAARPLAPVNLLDDSGRRLFLAEWPSRSIGQSQRKPMQHEATFCISIL